MEIRIFSKLFVKEEAGDYILLYSPTRFKNSRGRLFLRSKLLICVKHIAADSWFDCRFVTAVDCEFVDNNLYLAIKVPLGFVVAEDSKYFCYDDFAIFEAAFVPYGRS